MERNLILVIVIVIVLAVGSFFILGTVLPEKDGAPSGHFQNDSNSDAQQRRITALEEKLKTLEANSAKIAELENQIYELKLRLDSRQSRDFQVPTNANESPEQVKKTIKDIANNGELEKIVEDARKAKEERKLAYWKSRKPVVNTSIIETVAQKTDESELAIQQVYAESGNDREKFIANLSTKIRAMDFGPNCQLSVLAENGDFLFHVEDLKGNITGHLDVNGNDVGKAMLESKNRNGFLEYFDFVSENKARRNHTGYRFVPGPNVWIFLEGHEWEEKK